MKQPSIRKRFDNLYACIEVCMNNLSEQESFQAFCSVLSIEAQALATVLSNLSMQYEKALPTRSEEPEGVDWNKERELLQGLIDKLDLPNIIDFRCELLLGDLSCVVDYIGMIENALISEDNADIYANYSKRELDLYYNSGQWNSDQRILREEISKQSIARQAAFLEEQRIKWLEKLSEIAPCAVDAEKAVIYKEGLGRRLWGSRKNAEEFNEILKCVKASEFYCRKLNKEFTYLDREHTVEELMKPETKSEINKQKVNQDDLKEYIEFTCSCKKYFNTGYDEKWIVDFWTDMLKSPISDYIYNRLAVKTKKYKAQCQIIGELVKKEVFKGSTTKMAEAIRERQKQGKASGKSVNDYIRRGFIEEETTTDDTNKENNKISAWIQGYEPTKSET